MEYLIRLIQQYNSLSNEKERALSPERGSRQFAEYDCGDGYGHGDGGGYGDGNELMYSNMTNASGNGWGFGPDGDLSGGGYGDCGYGDGNGGVLLGRAPYLVQPPYLVSQWESENDRWNST